MILERIYTLENRGGFYMIGIVEGIVLISINDNGKFSKNTYNLVRYGLAGAIALELIQLKKVELKGKKLYLTEESNTGNEILDDALKVLRKPKSLRGWIGSNTIFVKRARTKILQGFVDKGIVREEEKRFLGLIPLKRYHITNTYEKQELISGARNTLLGDKAQCDTKDIYIVSLMVACKAVKVILSNEEYKRIKAKLKLIGRGKYFETEDQVLAVVIKAIKGAITSNNASVANAGIG